GGRPRGARRPRRCRDARGGRHRSARSRPVVPGPVLAGPVLAGPVVAGPVVVPVPAQAEPAGAPGATPVREAALGGRGQRAGALRAAGAVALVVPLVVELAGV